MEGPIPTNHAQPILQVNAPRPVAQLAGALAKAQAVMGGAKKDSKNPHLNSRYADLASVWEACREPLTSHGLSIVQFPEAEGSKVTVKTMLLHESGEYLETSISATAKDASPQAVGSVITYLRRYGLAAMVGIAPEDDDGEAAQGRSTNATTQQSKPTTPPAADKKPPNKPDLPDDPEAKEVQRLMVATSAEIARSGCPPELFGDWSKSKGYPTTRAGMNSKQLGEALDYLKTLPNASKTA